MITKHFVTFYSPGTFVSEQTTKEIESWDVNLAMYMADEINERHGATPYGFRFSTRENDGTSLDSEETKTSNFYWLGGKIETLEEIEDRGNPADAILLRNMKNNGYDRIVVNTNSWKFTGPLDKNDVVLSYKPRVRDNETHES